MAYPSPGQEQELVDGLQAAVLETKVGSGVPTAPPPVAGAPPPYTPSEGDFPRRMSADQYAPPHGPHGERRSLPLLPDTTKVPPAPCAPPGNQPVYLPPQPIAPPPFSPPYQQPQYYRNPQQEYRPPYAPQQFGSPAPRAPFVSPCKPIGYNVIDLFKTGNHLQLVPVSGTGKPLKIDWGKLTGSGGYGDQTSMFEVVVSQEPGATQFTLRNPEKNKFISLTDKAQVKLKTLRDADCEFNAHPVGTGETSVVCLESAAHPGQFLGCSSSGNTCGIEPPSMDVPEAHYRLRATRVLHKLNPTRPLRAYGRQSVLQNVYDRCTVQLCNKASRKYLGIDLRGVIMQTEDRSDEHILFMVYDRGMGVVSLRSWKHAGYWLRTTIGGALTTKGNPVGLDGDFQMKESYDGSICFSPLNFPNMMMAPPGSASCDFTLSTVVLAQNPQLPVARV